jgi:hypothetical protein
MFIEALEDKKPEGLRYSSVVQSMSSMCDALGSISARRRRRSQLW